MIQYFETKSQNKSKLERHGTDDNKGNLIGIINWICIRKEARSREIDHRNDKYYRHKFLCNLTFENCLV